MEAVIHIVKPESITVAAPAASQAPSVSADSQQVVRFEALMGHDEVAGPVKAALPAAQATPETFGDKILAGLRSMAAEMSGSLNDAAGAIPASGGSMSMAEMSRFHFNMVNLSIQHELLGKVAGRSTQNIDQLTKLQ